MKYTFFFELKTTGDVEDRIGVGDGTYSLGLTIDHNDNIIAAVRGQSLLKVFKVRFIGFFAIKFKFSFD